MEIRICEGSSLDLLDRWIPSNGRTSFHRRRFEQQVAGSGTYLVAWLDQRPVGHLLILWTGCAADESRHWPVRCPELNALGVWPPRQRRQGIGRALLGRAEAMVAERGYVAVGLGVADDNPDAFRLYQRLGYTTRVGRYVDRWTWVDHDGVERQEAEPCTFLAKSLT
ncbi:GNAT family N-acetyltransferase [Frankia sp. CNm7]|uniref:GNAT family N-acetyltransferase n=1 Tax=Frankia nepalensis TaxID=1836974 RepID=UPI00193297EA|nr:GNAT family N-acetyltransferase [Frankia nepalensis]MBL7494865.1 GNAT family N-acetyltransferase [Frankia nepalensis]MBL7512219.1 GNAT family N-acetyltransferase [Frankia nepalensis]MBL7516903.1 GNAT family N-acetyltransferase [Frankia nepalensis]